MYVWCSLLAIRKSVLKRKFMATIKPEVHTYIDYFIRKISIDR